MKLLKQVEVPTGHILVLDGEKGQLEMVSLGDYGREINLNENLTVGDQTPLMPLTDKWVLTISTQYGCSMGCRFCDVPRVGKGTNATMADLQGQVIAGLGTHPEVLYSNRLNVHYARMGEPTFNPAVLDHAKWMHEHINPEFNVHPVLTSMLPSKNEWLKTFLHTWIRIKNRVYRGNAGLQLSINSTSDTERQEMFSGNTLLLREVSKLFDGAIPVGRKFTLNFPVANWEIDPDKLLHYFDPERFIVKLTPLHKTANADRFGIETPGNYTNPDAYKGIAEDLRKAGWEVLVFIASEDEDKGMITCGNAILANVVEPRLRKGPLTFIGGSSVGTTQYKPWDSRSDQFEQKDKIHA